jgi:uncharacterized DUF497 family protein
MIRFDWDPDKAASNLKKHGISFEEARTVFFDENALQFFDSSHSVSEDRFIMLGMSSQANILVVCHCERDGGNTVRLISARKATQSESLHYGGTCHGN